MSNEKIINWLFGDRIPVTKLLIVINAVTFLMIYVVKSSQTRTLGVFTTVNAAQKPWTAFTYPLVGFYGTAGGAVFSLVFACYWLWVAGGSLERSWGSRAFGPFFAGTSALTALGVYVGAQLVGVPAYAYGLWVPLAAVTVAFASVNPEQVILLMFVLPLKLKYLGLLSAAALLVSMASFHPLVGICSLLGCAFAYWYVRNGLQYSGPSRRSRPASVVRVFEQEPFVDRISPLRWFTRWRNRRRLKKLFEDSGLHDEEHRP